jgi:bacterioferritin-associated ferredoxin
MGGLRLSRIYTDDGSRYKLWVGSKSRTSGSPVTVYVCICNALTDRQVKQAAIDAGTTKSSAIYAACGCRAQCGQCVRAMVALLRGEVSSVMEPAAPT